MASTPAHCSLTASKTPQTNIHNYRQNHHRRHSWNTPKVSLSKHSQPTSQNAAIPTTLSQNSTFHSLSSLSSPKSDIGPDFAGRQSTRFVSKIHLGRPKTSMGTRHTAVAEEALHHALQLGKDDVGLENVLLNFERKLCLSDDYTFLLRELGNRGECWKAVGCFKFAIKRESRNNEKGRLASAMIGTLGRLGKVDLAKDIFETALNEGYGHTVYAFSALISAYGRSRYFNEAIKVFETMKISGLKPNLVTYNAIIDACGKGGVDLQRVVEIFNEMLRNRVQPDRITYNSLLGVCSRGGLWEAARSLFNEMIGRGIDPDIFTYNTLLDVVCKGGQMDLASEIISDMPAKKILPNVVSYSTMVDGYAKVGRLEEALNLYNDMKFLDIRLDRVSYNTLLSIYAKLGKLEEASNVCKEMESSGVKKDVVTYNALLDGYGKLGKFDEVRRMFEQMKKERISPNLLTYSTLIDAFSKGGLYKEAMAVFREFKQAGLKADVVLYSELINALCKNGLVESARSLLDEMTKEGIRPNVFTYNSLIDAFGRSTSVEYLVDGKSSSSTVVIEDLIASEAGDLEDNQVLKVYQELSTENSGNPKMDKQGRHEILRILGVFRKMHELEIKPNVVTFSAILSACSRCNSFEDASMLLEELRLFDNKIYGVAHGLLTGCSKNVWVEAQSLFDEVKYMDSSTASAFYNALTDMLWHFGQKRGAQLVVLEGKRRNVWEGVWSDYCLDLHLMSSGAARGMVHAWLLNIRSVVYNGHELPKLLSILTGWGKHSKVVGDGTLKRVVEALLASMGAPFQVAKCNMGRFVSTGSVVAAWLKESGTLNLIVLEDDRTHPERLKEDQITKLQAIVL